MRIAFTPGTPIVRPEPPAKPPQPHGGPFFNVSSFISRIVAEMASHARDGVSTLGEVPSGKPNYDRQMPEGYHVEYQAMGINPNAPNGGRVLPKLVSDSAPADAPGRHDLRSDEIPDGYHVEYAAMGINPNAPNGGRVLPKLVHD